MTKEEAREVKMNCESNLQSDRSRLIEHKIDRLKLINSINTTQDELYKKELKKSLKQVDKLIKILTKQVLTALDKLATAIYNYEAHKNDEK